MKIVALVYISYSELLKMYNSDELSKIIDNKEALNKLLWDLGMDTTSSMEMQTSTHRNRFGEIVDGLRWVGNERIDSEWLNSGYASRAAIDKSKNNRLLNEFYRNRGQTE